MDFVSAIKVLNQALKKENPEKFSSSWIARYTPNVYRYIWKNVRTETNDIDWDTITSYLDRSFQKRWIRYKHKQAKEYENQYELNLVLNKYKDKLYTFITSVDETDKEIRNRI